MTLLTLSSLQPSSRGIFVSASYQKINVISSLKTSYFVVVVMFVLLSYFILEYGWGNINQVSIRIGIQCTFTLTFLQWTLISMKFHLIVPDHIISTLPPIPFIFWKTEVIGVITSGKYLIFYNRSKMIEMYLWKYCSAQTYLFRSISWHVGRICHHCPVAIPVFPSKCSWTRLKVSWIC